MYALDRLLLSEELKHLQRCSWMQARENMRKAALGLVLTAAAEEGPVIPIQGSELQSGEDAAK